MSFKDHLKDKADKLIDKYDDDAYAARDGVKGLWASNSVFRAAVVAAAVIAVVLLVAVA